MIQHLLPLLFPIAPITFDAIDQDFAFPDEPDSVWRERCRLVDEMVVEMATEEVCTGPGCKGCEQVPPPKFTWVVDR